MNNNLKKIFFNPVRYYGRLLRDDSEKIDLTLGEGHFNSPFNAKIKAYEAMLNNNTRYGKVDGEDSLRKMIAEKYYPKYNYKKEIAIANGSTNALFSTLLALLNKGDEVIIIAPFYPLYTQILELLDVKAVIIDTIETEFKVTVELLEKHVTYKTKAIIINEPCNPTGVVYSKQEKHALMEYLSYKNMYIIIDELYRHYTDEAYVSFSELLSEYKQLVEKFVFINGLSKSHLMTGYRIGYAVGHEEIIHEIIKLNFINISCVSIIMQEAAIGALTDDDYSEFVRTYYLKNTKIVRESLDDLGIIYVKNSCGYYLFVDISPFKMTDIEFCQYFIDHYNVALVPGFLFGEQYNHYVRISCCKDIRDIIKFIHILTEYVNNNKKT